MLKLTDKYDVDETVVRIAARHGSNATFTHWRARLGNRTPEVGPCAAQVRTVMLLHGPPIQPRSPCHFAPVLRVGTWSAE
jgi:hypothetical protein